MDATIRDCLLAPARITTQCRETTLTHREDRRDDDEADRADFAADVARAFDATEPTVDDLVDAVVFDAIARVAGSGAMVESLGANSGSGDASLTMPAATLLPRAMLSVVAIIVRERALSVVVVVGWVAMTVVSACRDADADFAASVFIRTRRGSRGSSSRRTHAVPTIATRTAAPTPLQTLGPIGGRSGSVPHHRHFPNFSG